MEYYIKSVIPVIESNYNKFTMVEKTIADFFINNQKKINFSAKSVATKLFVSEAFPVTICPEVWISGL